MGTIFDPDTLQEIACKGIGLPFDEMERAVADGLRQEYGRHIARRSRWMFNLAGGATGMMNVLHASLSEYVILFGSAIGTEAFSGRYRMDIWDIVISGEMWTYTESRVGERVVTKVGERAYLQRGDVKGYRISEGTWMLEYARGLIPLSLPMGLGDAVFSGQDPKTIYKTLTAYGGLVIGELLRGKI